MRQELLNAKMATKSYYFGVVLHLAKLYFICIPKLFVVALGIYEKEFADRREGNYELV